jgi:hypothetical protein
VAFLLEQAFWARPQYFEVPAWAGIEEVAVQIAHYEHALLSGRGSGVVWGSCLGTLFAVGMWTIASQRFGGRTLFLTLWLFFPALVLLASNSLPWQRYYLVLHAPVALLCGLGLWKMSQLVVGVIGEGKRREEGEEAAY